MRFEPPFSPRTPPWGSEDTPSQSEAIRPPIPPAKNLSPLGSNLRDLRGDLSEACLRAREIVIEARAVPDLDPGADARDRHFLFELRVLAQIVRDQDPPLRIGSALGRSRYHEPLQLVTLEPERIDSGEALLVGLPVVAGEEGVSPGQACVFSDSGQGQARVLGGGFIRAAAATARAA